MVLTTNISIYGNGWEAETPKQLLVPTTGWSPYRNSYSWLCSIYQQFYCWPHSSQDQNMSYICIYISFQYGFFTCILVTCTSRPTNDRTVCTQTSKILKKQFNCSPPLSEAVMRERKRVEMAAMSTSLAPPSEGLAAMIPSHSWERSVRPSCKIHFSRQNFPLAVSAMPVGQGSALIQERVTSLDICRRQTQLAGSHLPCNVGWQTDGQINSALFAFRAKPCCSTPSERFRGDNVSLRDVKCSFPEHQWTGGAVAGKRRRREFTRQQVTPSPSNLQPFFVVVVHFALSLSRSSFSLSTLYYYFYMSVFMSTAFY